MSYSPTVPSTHRCPECFRGPDETEFSSHVDGIHGTGTCLECTAMLAVKTSQARVEKAQGDQINQLIRATISKRTKLPEWQQMISDLINRFGGPTGLVDRTYMHLDKILDDNPGTGLALNALRFLYRLVERGMEEQQLDLEVTNLSDEKLNELAEQFLIERFGRCLPDGKLPSGLRDDAEDD